MAFELTGVDSLLANEEAIAYMVALELQQEKDARSLRRGKAISQQSGKARASRLVTEQAKAKN